MSKRSELAKMTGFLDSLDEAGIHYTMASVREGAVIVCATVPGERWEIEFLDDGKVEVEVFQSDGEVRDFGAVEEMFERHHEEEQADEG